MQWYRGTAVDCLPGGYLPQTHTHKERKHERIVLQYMGTDKQSTSFIDESGKLRKRKITPW